MDVPLQLVKMDVMSSRIQHSRLLEQFLALEKETHPAKVWAIARKLSEVQALPLLSQLRSPGACREPAQLRRLKLHSLLNHDPSGAATSDYQPDLSLGFSGRIS